MIKRFISSLSLICLCLFAAPLTVSAYDAFRVDCSGEAAKSAVCQDDKKTDNLTGNNGALLKIADIVAYVAGAAAIIMIIVGAIKFATSGSDISTSSRTDTDVEDAKHMIANALIGLVIIILAKTIIVFVIKKI